MQIKLSEANGIFQVDNHTSFSRLLWTVLVLASLSIIVFKVWGGTVDLFGVSKIVTSKYLQFTIEVLAFYCVPVIASIVGLAKIIKKPGNYAVGARVVKKGVEIGTLSINANSPLSEILYATTLTADGISGDWKREKNSIYTSINISIVLRKEQEQSNRYLLERVVLSSGGERLIELFGHKNVWAKRDIFVAISKGTLYSLGNDYRICLDDLSSFRQLMSDIVTGWQPSFALSCTLQILPSFASFDNIASIGVLGGFNKTSTGPFNLTS